MTNFIKYFYPKKSVKRKILDVVDEIKRTVRLVYKNDFWVDWYGAYYINPDSLVIWIWVKSDQDKMSLRSNEKLMLSLRDTLVLCGYPEQARSSVAIIFESQQTADRDFNGSWHERYMDGHV